MRSNLRYFLRIRVELRDLMKFLDSDNISIYYSTFTDHFTGEPTEHELVFSFNANTFATRQIKNP